MTQVVNPNILKDLALLALFTASAVSWGSPLIRCDDPVAEGAEVIQQGFFAQTSVSDFALEAPLSALFANARYHTEHGLRGEIHYREPGTHVTKVLEVDVFTRGASSLEDCKFKKLKLKLVNPVGTLFSGTGIINLGTHCDTLAENVLTPDGRLGNERAAFREALVYNLLEDLGVKAPKAKPVSMTYVDTNDGQVTNYRAFFQEAPGAAAARYGAIRVDAATWLGSRTKLLGRLDVAEVARAAFARAMVGDTDFKVPSKDDPGVKNFKILRYPNGDESILSHDFDHARAVVGLAPAPPFKEIILEIPNEVLKPTTHFFFEQRDRIEARIKTSLAGDREGREVFLAHVKTFFAALKKL